MADKLYTGNTVTLVVDCDITTTAAARCYLYVQKPDGTEAVWTGTAASVTCIVYTTTSTDLNTKGIYNGNAYQQDTTSTSWNFTGKSFQFRVYDRHE
jgi:hypothetical protein